MKVHKNARLTPQGRLLMVRRIEEEGWKVADAALAAGLSERRAHHWLARYRAGGEIALHDKSSTPARYRDPTPNPRDAEIVGLLCVRDAKEGGMSIYSSSLKVHEIIAREHPEYLAVLERGFRCDRRGEESPEDDAVTPYRVPVFSEQEGLLSTRFVRGVIDRAAETLGAPLSPLEKAALDFFDEVARRDEVRLELRLAPGEASFINNYELLHARTAFVDHDDLAKKRLLYRLWLQGDPPRPMRKEVHLYQNRSGRMGVDPQPGRGPR